MGSACNSGHCHDTLDTTSSRIFLLLLPNVSTYSIICYFFRIVTFQTTKRSAISSGMNKTYCQNCFVRVDTIFGAMRMGKNMMSKKLWYVYEVCMSMYDKLRNFREYLWSLTCLTACRISLANFLLVFLIDIYIKTQRL